MQLKRRDRNSAVSALSSSDAPLVSREPARGNAGRLDEQKKESQRQLGLAVESRKQEFLIVGGAFMRTGSFRCLLGSPR
jgi:hypothetical protein